MWWALPRKHRVIGPASLLDKYAPEWQFGEVHRLRVNAPPEHTLAAAREVTAGEIRLFRTLTWVRRLGRPGPEDVLNAPVDRPLLDVATQTGFLLLEENPQREFVVGVVLSGASRPRTAAEFTQLTGRAVAKAALNFLAMADGEGGTMLTTETRVWTAEGSARRRFAAYWAFIYPGSALIRRMWLQAIKRRAEAGLPAQPPPQDAFAHGVEER